MFILRGVCGVGGLGGGGGSFGILSALATATSLYVVTGTFHENIIAECFLLVMHKCWYLVPCFIKLNAEKMSD
jgi:hypothetical protein